MGRMEEWNGGIMEYCKETNQKKMKDLKLLEAIEDRLDLEDVEKALADPKNKKAIPWEKVRKDLGL